jgi:predicted Kef-type K+ transport protein
MPHAPSILATIVLELLLTASGGLLARKLCLRPLVEYWRPAALSRPITPGFIGDLANQLAEIGIIRLTFGASHQQDTLDRKVEPAIGAGVA